MINVKFLLLNILFMFGCKTIPGDGASKNSGYITMGSGLQFQILKKGEGRAAKEGESILLFETTSYRNGTVLYSNENTNFPVKVLIG